jgi:hypothetical protein
MLQVVSPEIPLNPADWPAFQFNQEYLRRLDTVNARTVFCLNALQIIPLIPSGSHVRGSEPFLKQRKIGSFKWLE